MHIYMESRKMILMNLFAGQQWTCRHREQTCGHGLGEGEGGITGESNMETYALPYVKWIVGTCCLMQGTQNGA